MALRVIISWIDPGLCVIMRMNPFEGALETAPRGV